jgi:hypothetical protein
MSHSSTGFAARLKGSLPWLVRYPLWRAAEIARRPWEARRPCHLILVVANHFEPGWSAHGGWVDPGTQRERLRGWCAQARRIGAAVRDSDGKPFRHTYFYPGEQYDSAQLEMLAALQQDGFGEVEVHLHHGGERPDTPENLRETLLRFRDLLAERHGCLSRWEGVGPPQYAFVHGNLALANSAGGHWCGVDSEMEILAQTGCYADLTLPSAPERSQVPRLNAIYQCGHPLDRRAPHRSGPDVAVGRRPQLPILFTGPLVLRWRLGPRFPRLQLDGGSLGAAYPLDLERLHRWRSARIRVRGRPEWVFVKLSCHGFFTGEQEMTLGEPMRRFLEAVREFGEKSGQFTVHFATAREAFNLMMAAVDGRSGNPGLYRDYRLRPMGVSPSSSCLGGVRVGNSQPAANGRTRPQGF